MLLVLRPRAREHTPLLYAAEVDIAIDILLLCLQVPFEDIGGMLDALRAKGEMSSVCKGAKVTYVPLRTADDGENVYNTARR